MEHFPAAIFHKGDDEYMSAFFKAISDTTKEYNVPAFNLTPIIRHIDTDADSFKAAEIGKYANL